MQSTVNPPPPDTVIGFGTAPAFSDPLSVRGIPEFERSLGFIDLVARARTTGRKVGEVAELEGSGIRYYVEDAKSMPKWVVDFDADTFQPQTDADDNICRNWGVERLTSKSRFSSKRVPLMKQRMEWKRDYNASGLYLPEEQAAQQIARRLVAKMVAARKTPEKAAYLKRWAVLNVTLPQGANPFCWRRYLVPLSIPLNVLVELILLPTLGWYRDRYCYMVSDPSTGACFGPPNDYLFDKQLLYWHTFCMIDASEALLGDILTPDGQNNLTFTYHLGYRWEHVVALMGVLPENLEEMKNHKLRCSLYGLRPEAPMRPWDKSELRVSVIAGGGACPPEDGRGLETGTDFQVCMSYERAPFGTEGEGRSLMLLDTNAMEIYRRAIEPNKGWLVHKRHPKYRESLEDLREAKNYKPDSSSTEEAALNAIGYFDPNACSSEDVNRFLLMNLDAKMYYFCTCKGPNLPQGGECKFCYFKKTKRGRAFGYICGFCGITAMAAGKKLLKCGRCKMNWYCSAACQKTQWSFHKAICKIDPNDPDAFWSGEDASKEQ